MCQNRSILHRQVHIMTGFVVLTLQMMYYVSPHLGVCANKLEAQALVAYKKAPTLTGPYNYQQGWDKYCPAGKFQWLMPEIVGTANTPKIT